MADDIEDLWKAFSKQTERNYANNIMHLTTLSFLLDHEIVTVEDIAQRIEEVQSVLPERYRSEDVGKRIALVVDVLRAVDERPTSTWTPK